MEDPQSSQKNEQNQAADQIESQRRQRVFDQLHDALAKPNALEANLGVMNSDLLQIASHLKQTIVEALAAGGNSLDELNPLFPAIGVWLKVMKQFDHFSRLEIKLNGAEKAIKEAVKEAIKEAKLPSAATGQSEDSQS